MLFTKACLPCLFLLAPAATVASRFERVLPRPAPGWLPGQRRAVVLIHGLYLHPFSADNVARPLLRDWQTPRGRLARELAKDSDVYAFAYAQDVPVDAVASGSTLLEEVRRLRRLGYREVVLVGHSAGGLVARQLVEDHPDAGVTKVVQVCCPNGGSSWAKLTAVRKTQKVFLGSLTKEARRGARAGARLPAGVVFVCVVGTGAGEGDGVVRRDCQWTADLRAQGVPALALAATHPSAMRGGRGVALVAALVRRRCPRWTTGQVELARKAILEGREPAAERKRAKPGPAAGLTPAGPVPTVEGVRGKDR